MCSTQLMASGIKLIIAVTIENIIINTIAFTAFFLSHSLFSTSSTYPAKKTAVKYPPNMPVKYIAAHNVPTDIPNFVFCIFSCNGVQREHNKKLNNGLPILHKVPPKRDYGRYFCIMAEKGGTSHGGLTEKLSLFFHAKKQEVNAYGR